MRPPLHQILVCALRWRCPNCQQGWLFGGWFKMLPQCQRCGLSYFPESGYYVGAMIINYIVSAILITAIYLLLSVLPDITSLSPDTKLMLWLVFAVLLALSLMRHSYSLWLAVDFWINPWKPELPGESPRREGLSTDSRRF